MCGLDRGGGDFIDEHSFCIFFFSATKHNRLHQSRELVSGAGRACSVEVEALFHGCGEKALSHDLLR